MPSKQKKPTGHKSVRRGVGIRRIDPKDLRIKEEVRYIQRRAAQFDSRIIGLGHILSFSTATGDAWLLDPADHLAARIARDGTPEPIDIEETDTSYRIRWKGDYQIDGDAFIYSDRETGRVVTISGYPTQKITEFIELFHSQN